MRSPESRPGHRPGKMFEEELNLRYLSPGAFTILSPDDHGPSPDPPLAPPSYKLSPTPRRHKNQAFSIIAEPTLTPRSRSPSPNGRVSPFRGRGFNPVGSRHASPASSPPPPPEDSRILLNSKQQNTKGKVKSQIPQLKREVRRSNSMIQTDDSDSSPKFRRKDESSLKPQLSKSLNYIGPKNVSYKPPPSPRRHPGLYTKGQAFNRLSPIIGSSPEPSSDSKSQSSPATRIPKSRSTPPSRKQSPTRDSSDSPDFRGSTSRLHSRINSRNVSRDGSPTKPPFSPTRIPVRNYKNIQAKVNSNSNNNVSNNNNNAKSTTNQSKVPTKSQEVRNKIGETKTTTSSNNNNNNNNRGRTKILNRTESVKNVSKINAPKKYGSNNNISKVGNNNNTNNNSNKTSLRKSLNSGSKTNLAEKKTKFTGSIKKKEDSKLKINEKEKEKVPADTTTTTSTSESESSDNVKATPSSTKFGANKTATNNSNKSNNNNNDVVVVGGNSGGGGNNNKNQNQNQNSPLKKVESHPKLTDMLPSATTVVTSTTATVTQPLKIETKLDTPMKQDGSNNKLQQKETKMYMDEDSQTLMKDHNMSKLSPAASAIISLSNDGNSTSTTNAVPNVETTTKNIGQNVVNSTVSNNQTHTNNNGGGGNSGPNNNVKNNINRLISPDDSFGAKVNNHNEKSANERILEARTMVASDVKPIRITVQEKPSNVEVQSGNVRFPPNATNGISSAGSGMPPPQPQQGENGNQQQEPQPPKSRCQLIVEKFRNKMPCACCKPKIDEIVNKTEEKKRGCFDCLKKKKNETEEIIVTHVDEVESAKKSFMDRLKCCRSNKVGDSTTGCCGRGKRKDSWAERRDSILSEPPILTRGQKCKNFFKSLFCCCCGCSTCSRCCKKESQALRIDDNASRRASMLSKKKSLTPTVLPPEEPKDKLDVSLVEYTSTMKAAIPVLPVALAYFCLFFNVIAPGTGTVFSGLFCLCMGKPRFSQRDSPKARFGSFLINVIIGCGQCFTVLFCLVGWGWSIWWGAIMLKVAKKHRKLKKIEKRMEAQQEKAAAAASSSNRNRRDVEKGRS